jgi:hypothetical protein
MRGVDDGTRTCAKCGHTIAPRGGRPPRFCAVCGVPLPHVLVQVRHQFAPPERPIGLAVAALVLGTISFTPACGLPVGIVAVLLGIAARRRIARSDQALSGSGLAAVGIILGAIGAVLQIVWVSH